eukprot:UN25176
MAELDIDVLVTGHTHEIYYNQWVPNNHERIIHLVQCDAMGRFVGTLELDLIYKDSENVSVELRSDSHVCRTGLSCVENDRRNTN